MNYRELAERLNAGERVHIRTGLDGANFGAMQLEHTENTHGVIHTPSGRWFCETLDGERELIICGGGHISKPLCQLGVMLGYAVTVIDDRPEFANEQRFPQARVLCETFDAVMGHRFSPNASYIIVTRGHHDDARCLSRILRRGFFYCGMIGSKQKVHAVMERMREQRFSEQQLARVHSPIGLKIGAQTPEEIAVSIAAELISVQSQAPAAILPADVLHALLTQHQRMYMVLILERTGSAPRGPGARMLVCADGSYYGTIGGGAVEHEAIAQAVQLCGNGRSERVTYNVGNGEAAHLGMVCGGTIDVLFVPVEE